MCLLRLVGSAFGAEMQSFKWKHAQLIFYWLEVQPIGVRWSFCIIIWSTVQPDRVSATLKLPHAQIMSDASWVESLSSIGVGDTCLVDVHSEISSTDCSKTPYKHSVNFHRFWRFSIIYYQFHCAMLLHFISNFQISTWIRKLFSSGVSELCDLGAWMADWKCQGNAVFSHYF